MGKDAWFRDFDMKPAANLSSKVIGRLAHNCIWSRRDLLTPGSRQAESQLMVRHELAQRRATSLRRRPDQVFAPQS